MLHWILNLRARSRVVGLSMWPEASDILLVFTKIPSQAKVKALGVGAKVAALSY